MTTSLHDPLREPQHTIVSHNHDALVHLRADGVSVVVDTSGSRLPRIVHWGRDLGELSAADLAQVRLATRPQPIGYSVDGPVDVAVLPEQSAGWTGTPGLTGHRDGASFSTQFTVVATALRTEDLAPGIAAQLSVTARDDDAGLHLVYTLELTRSGLVRHRGRVTNTGDDAFTLDRLLLTLPVPDAATELLDFTGHHLRERQPQRTEFNHGIRLRENRTGRTGYDAAYLLTAGTAGFANRHGEVWGMHTAWSGNHTSLAERSYHAVSLLGGAELLLAGEGILAPGAAYESPWLYGSHSADGLDGLSARFHTYLRQRPTHPRSPRPVVVNTWEAVYFDHSLERLSDLAVRASEIGAERFVLDDGWFGSRRDDSRGLGDWYVSDEVWPDGLGPLIDVVTDLGMGFGLWVEPEMINPDSDLARAHPEWILATGGRLPRPARSQQVLDLGVPEAFDHIYSRLDALLTEHDISYLKWDHNRDLVDAGHQPRGEAGVHDQTLATYRLLDALRAAHPGVEIESCSSGGGRVDLAILERTDRVWGSDCIDALERQQITRWTNLLVPFELIGAHIGSALAHTTDRQHPLSFRAGTALFGHLGIEWDLTATTEDERAELSRWVALYKELRELLHTGTSVHADVQNPALLLYGVVSPAQDDALFALVATATSASYPPGAATLPGLDPDTRYHVRPQAPADVADGNAARWGVPLPWWSPEGVTMTGRALAAVGLQLPVLFPERMCLVRVTAVP